MSGFATRCVVAREIDVAPADVGADGLVTDAALIRDELSALEHAAARVN